MKKTKKQLVDEKLDPRITEFLQHERDVIVDGLLTITRDLQWKACLHPRLRKYFDILCRTKDEISWLDRR